MRKSLFWTAIASSAVGLINLILYIVFSIKGIVEMKALSYVFVFGFIVCAWLPYFLNLIFKTKIDLAISICYQIFLLLALIIGSLWRVYGKWQPYDCIVHFGSGILISMIGYMFYQNSKKSHFSLVWLFVVLFSIGVMCAGLWEIYEFVSDGLVGNNAQGFTGLVGRDALVDTMIDMICGTGGAIIGSIIPVLLEKSKRKKQDIGND